MITLTDNAVNQIKEMMKVQEGEVHLRFGVTGGGCSGLSYSLGFDENQLEDDTLYQINGLDVLIHNRDIPIIKNTVIDFKQNMLGGGFTIENPNAIASCGCGSSFRTKKEPGTPTDC